MSQQKFGNDRRCCVVSLGLRIIIEEALGGELERGGGVGPSTAFSGVILEK